MSKRAYVFGLGETGFAFARYLQNNKIPFAMVDSREAPKQLQRFKQDFPGVEVHTGPFQASLHQDAEVFYMSPGLDPNAAFFKTAQTQGVQLCGDAELFSQQARAPIVAITGTNGKSTVTAWLNHVCSFSKKRTLMGGNIGIPTLDLLAEPVPDFYILELSSFQLELNESLGFFAGCITNVTADHLDRHQHIETYAQIKQRIYSEKGFNIYNLDDPLTYPRLAKSEYAFSIQQEQCRYHVNSGNLMSADERLLSVDELQLAGKQNWQNALAVIALAESMQIERDAIIEGLKTFTGLPHRCELVATVQGARWLNDSKGTNVGASIAAIEGVELSSDNHLVVILGGQGKGADFLPLAEKLKAKHAVAVIYGEDAAKISAACETQKVRYERVDTLSQAVKVAYTETKVGDVVLFSPACASFDMFENFEKRGDAFKEEVQKLS